MGGEHVPGLSTRSRTELLDRPGRSVGEAHHRTMMRPSRTFNRWPLWLGLQVLLAVLGAVLLFWSHTWAVADVTTFYAWSEEIVKGRIPYRDFFFEYPPLALLPLLVPRLVTLMGELTFGGYLVLFATL